MWLAMAAMIVVGLAIIVAAEPIARFAIDDDEVVRLTVVFIYILGACQPLMAVEFTLSGALRGAGDTRFPLFTVLIGFFGVRIPLAAWFAWRGFSVEWVYAALIADYIVKGSMLSLRFRRGRWQRLEV